MAFIEVITSKHVDPASILRKLGKDPLILDDPDYQLDLSTTLNFLQLACEATGDNLLGLHAGNIIHPSHWGVVSYVMLSSSSMGEALQNTIRYEGIVNSAIQTKIEEIEGRIHHTIDFPDVDSAEIIKPLVEYDFSALLQCAEFLVDGPGERVSYLCEGHFRHSQPNTKEELEEYHRAFGHNLTFSAPSNTLVYSGDILQRPVMTANQDLMPSLLKHVDSIHRQVIGEELSITEKVSYHIKKQLYTGSTSRQCVADALEISSSTLQRRLQEEGSSFRELVELVRQEVAKELLEEANISLIDLAFLLGYSNASAFNNAFKKWTGYTPKKYQLKFQQKN